MSGFCSSFGLCLVLLVPEPATFTLGLVAAVGLAAAAIRALVEWLLPRIAGRRKKEPDCLLSEINGPPVFPTRC